MAENESEDQGQQSQGQVPTTEENKSSVGQELAQKGKEEASKKLKKEASKAVAKGAAKQSLLAALGPYLLIAFLIIVAIIIIIGIAMFLVTMPGMVMDKLKEISKAVGNYISAFFGADTTEQIDDIEIYETLDYLEQMGWDLKGEGFLTDYMTESDVTEAKENLEDSENATLDSEVGVVRNDNDEIVKAESDFIFKYIASDNYVYTIKNNNLKTQGKEDSFFEKLFATIVTVEYKIRNFLFGPLYDVLGITEDLYGRFGVGLIAIRKEDGSIGAEGDLVNTETIWNWDSIKINTENNTLSIARNSPISTLKAAVTGQDLFNNPMEFSLDGWTGRYGMPLEFLLAIHKATMMPDLSYDMVETFGTEVNILLHEIDGSAIATYKSSTGATLGFDKLNKALNDMEGSNFFSAVISWFDNLNVNEQEAQIAFKLGVEHSPDCTCEKGTIEVYTYNGNEVIQEGNKYYYMDGEEKKEVSKDDLEVSASQSDEYVTICDECQDYIKTLMQVLQANTNYDYQAYSPYISSVKDHWYRDVYFVVNKSNLEFVDYDYDYQIMTGERWTLYETDDDGNYVYYVIDDDGNYVEENGEYKKYEGNVVSGEVEYVKTDDSSDTIRIASIGEDGTKVAKKAVTIKSSETDKLLDLGWNNNNKDGIWTAYEEVDGSTSTMEPLFEDVEDDGSYESIIKQNCYINLTTSGNIAQVGEGQRTETNSEIKKMFLTNNYFRYDGTDQTAEIIAAFRDSLYGDSENRYGPIAEDKIYDVDGNSIEYHLDFSDSKYTSGAETDDYKLSDYVGNVTLNQDSLNAFTILENTHTLDADYIYRDFKELVVELGYFEKEELTDETPKLLQFIVPDIGSNGYPDSSLDKRENEYGTMIHSESDIEVNNKHSLEAVITKAIEDGSQRTDTDAPVGEIDALDSMIENDVSVGKVKKYDSTTADLTSVGAIASVKPATVKEEAAPSGSDSKHVIDYTFNGIKYEGWSQTKSTCTLYAFAFMAAAYNGKSNEEYLTNSSGSYCSLGSGISNAYWTDSSYFLGFGDTIEGTAYSGPDPSTVEEPIAQALSESIPVYFFSGFKSSAGNHAVVLLGSNDSGQVLYYNPGSGVIEEYGDSGSFESNLHSLLNEGAYEQGGHIYYVFIPNEPPEGVKEESTADPYVGYEGNEAVVSPVTGILLEYGTYEKVETTELTDDEGNKITTEDPRVNVDLKYGFPNIYENTSDGELDGQQEEFESQTVSDKVGYAKILVLDAESYQKLESGTSNSWQSDSLVKIDQTTATLEDSEQVTSKRVSFREALTGEVPDSKKNDDDYDYSEEYEDWSTLDKTVYGYKEFAETYEKYGIAGYVVYIDGFKCELPDPNLSGEEGDDDSGESVASQIPASDSERTLTMDSFKKITETELKDTTETPEDAIESKYEPDEAYKLASEKSTNKLSAEIDLKTQAVSSIAVGDLVFIKEGTVIGRTLTDKELLESSDYRNSEYGTYEELRGDLETEDEGTGSGEGSDGSDDSSDNLKLIGNYLRIIMRDTDGTVVEDVENYMKLDEGTKKSVDNDWALFYWLPFESGGTDNDGSGPECQGSCSTGETAVGIIQWTVLTSKNMNNIGSQFIPGCLEADSSLCSPLSAYSSWSADDFWNDWNGGSKQFQKTLSSICDTDRDGFLNCQMEVAKKQYLEPILESYPWLEDRPSCVQGEIMHLSVWGASYSWISSYESASDEEIIKKVRNTIANTSSTAGEATGDESSGRAYNEPQIALEILNGSMSEDDVEQWVRTADSSYLSFDMK